MAFDIGNVATGATAGFAAFGIPGAIGGGILGLFGGKKNKKKKLSTFDENQEKLYKDYTDSLRGEGPFSDLYNFDSDQANDVFDQTIGNPAIRNYKEKIVPGITGQFRGKNLQNSSYLGQSLANSGRDVQEGLDAQRAKYQFEGQQGAQNRKANGINSVLNMNTFAYDKAPQEGNFVDQILSATGQQSATWLADYLKGLNNKKTISGYVPAR